MIHLAKGPCQRCGHVNDDILLTGESWPANDGGTFWRVADGELCLLCGHTLPLFYERPIVLEMPARVLDLQTVIA